MVEFVAPKWQVLLVLNQLDSFDMVWRCKVAWVETPNVDRGGISGVGRVMLQSSQGDAVGAFIKRQQNHTRFSWRHPLRGEATFRREFYIVQHLRHHGVPTLEPMLFSESYAGPEMRAVLMTVALDGYQPLDVLMANPEFAQMTSQEKRRLLAAAAETVRKMHTSGVEHRSLYAKHLFAMRQADGYRVVVIDLEKSRRNLLPVLRTVSDLVTLNYRTPVWSRSQRLYFFKQYYATPSLNAWQRILCRLIVWRSRKKRQSKA